MSEIRINKFNVKVSFFKEDDTYIAYCPELQISTYADSKSKIRDRFKERLEMFFELGLEDGTLFEQLKELGWNIVSVDKITPPEEVTVPKELLAAKHCKSQVFSYSF